MTSPYATTLLNEPVETTAPRAPQHTRSVTHVVPQPVFAPAQPQVVYAAPSSGGGAASSLLLAIVVILVGAIALVGAYAATQQAAPTMREAGLSQSLAMRDGYRAGRERGVVQGREQALANASTTTAIRTAAAREQAYAAAFRRGERAGRGSYRAPRYSGGSGYRAPRFGGFGNADVIGAFGVAQSLANATGAAVDVEVY